MKNLILFKIVSAVVLLFISFQITFVTALSLSNPYKNNMSEKTTTILHKFINKIEGKKTSLSGIDYNKLLKNLEDKLNVLKDKYITKTAIVNIIDYLIYEIDELYIDEYELVIDNYDPNKTFSCYNNDIYRYDSNDIKTTLKQPCGFDVKSYANNSFCEINSSGKTQQVSYKETYKYRCTEEIKGQAKCVSDAETNPIKTHTLEVKNAKSFIFTKSISFANNSSYFYIGEPITENSVQYYINSVFPKIKNYIKTSGVLWEGDILKKDPSNSYARVPTKIISDLKPYFKENGLTPSIKTCEDQTSTSSISYCSDINTLVSEKKHYKGSGNCIQGFTDSYYYTNKSFVSGICEMESTPWKIEILSSRTCSGFCNTDQSIPYCATWPDSTTFKGYSTSRINAFADTLLTGDAHNYKNCNNMSLNIDDAKPMCCPNLGCAVGNSCHANGHISDTGYVGPINSPGYGDLTVKYKCTDNNRVLID